jgi:hypothetical protein
LGAVEREDDHRQAAGRLKNAALELSPWTMPRRLEELGGEWEWRWKTGR